jgi:hypothetical protein
VKLQDQWGDHLAATGQLDAAISHFIEAGESLKAARAAVDAENLARAAPLVDVLPPAEQEALSGRLADLFKAAGDLQKATTYYVRAGRPTAAVHMYFDADRFDDATKVRPPVGLSTHSQEFCLSNAIRSLAQLVPLVDVLLPAEQEVLRGGLLTCSSQRVTCRRRKRTTSALAGRPLGAHVLTLIHMYLYFDTDRFDDDDDDHHRFDDATKLWLHLVGLWSHFQSSCLPGSLGFEDLLALIKPLLKSG